MRSLSGLVSRDITLAHTAVWFLGAVSPWRRNGDGSRTRRTRRARGGDISSSAGTARCILEFDRPSASSGEPMGTKRHAGGSPAKVLGIAAGVLWIAGCAVIATASLSLAMGWSAAGAALAVGLSAMPHRSWRVVTIILSLVVGFLLGWWGGALVIPSLLIAGIAVVCWPDRWHAETSRTTSPRPQPLV